MIATDNERPVSDLVDIRRIIENLCRSWRLCVVVSFIAMVLLDVAIFRLTPLFRASVTVAPSISEHSPGGISGSLGQLGGLASLIGVGMPNASGETEQALAVLESRKFTAAFVRHWKLLDTILPAEVEALPSAPPQNPAVSEIPERAFIRFNTKFRHVVRDKKSGLVQIQVDWKDPDVAAMLANDMVRQLNADLRSRAIQQATVSLRYLEGALVSTETIEVRQAINALVESQTKQRMLATVNEDYAFRVIDPAVRADPDRPVWPPRLPLLLVSPFVGFAVGLGVVLLFGRARRESV